MVQSEITTIQEGHVFEWVNGNMIFVRLEVKEIRVDRAFDGTYRTLIVCKGSYGGRAAHDTLTRDELIDLLEENKVEQIRPTVEVD